MKDQLIKKIFLIAGIIAVLGVASSSVVISSPASAQTLAEKDSSSAEKIVVFIEVDNPKTKNQLKALPDVVLRHDFPNGFSATIPAPAREGIEKRPSVTVHDVPIHRLLAPSDQTPYGIEQIYDDPSITSTSGGAGVVIGHLDTGVDKDHPDLKNRIVGCNDATKSGIRNGCGDSNGHGTHTAGTAVADGGDGTGIFGVAPDATVWAVKVCKRFCFTDDIAAAIDFLGDKVQIITMSIGGDTESSLIRDAINRNPHILYVAAAGNDGPSAGSIDYPGANQNVIAVAAIDSSKTVASFSSRGIDDGNDSVISEKEVELSAAGVGVLSTWNNGGYNSISGTSMATPHIAGLAAKEWQGNAADTRAYLRTYAEDIAGLGYDIASGYGLAHVTPVQTTPTISIDDVPLAEGNAGTTSFTFTITRSSDVGAISVDYATADGTGDAATEPSDYTAVATTTVNFIDGGGVLSKQVTIDVNGDTDVEPDENFVVNLTNCSGCTISDNQGVGTIIDDDTAPNNPPTANDDSKVTDEDIAKLITLEGTDVDGDAITLFTIASGPTSGSLGAIGAITCTPSSCTADVTYTPDLNFNGADSFTFTVKDATLTSAAAKVTITVNNPSAGVSVDSIRYDTHGGKDGLKHLDITIALLDDFAIPVSGASVSIRLDNTSTGDFWTGTGTTDGGGVVIFSLNNAPSGCYTTTVTGVTANGLTFNGGTPDNSFPLRVVPC